MSLIGKKEEQTEQYSFIYGNEAIRYFVSRKAHVDGKKRKITINVQPSCDVIVTAPVDAEPKDIHQAVMKRARWIYDALQSFKEQLTHVQAKSYESGEMLFYLGRRYMLKVMEDENAIANVKMQRGKLIVTLQRFNQEKNKLVKALLSGWYERRAESIFHSRLSELLPRAAWVKGIPSFRVKRMQKQWGSCSAKGSLMLNPHLVKAPNECIDYVILHELCHIAEHNHSEHFYRLLTSVMPNWTEVKSRLDGMAELYLNE